MIVRFHRITIPASNIYSIALKDERHIYVDYMATALGRVDMEKQMATFEELYESASDAEAALIKYSAELKNALRF